MKENIHFPSDPAWPAAHIANFLFEFYVLRAVLMFNVEDYFDADDNTDDNFDTYADADAVAESRCHHSAVAAALLILAKLNFVRIGGSS